MTSSYLFDKFNCTNIERPKNKTNYFKNCFALTTAKGRNNLPISLKEEKMLRWVIFTTGINIIIYLTVHLFSFSFFLTFPPSGKASVIHITKPQKCTEKKLLCRHNCSMGDEKKYIYLAKPKSGAPIFLLAFIEISAYRMDVVPHRSFLKLYIFLMHMQQTPHQQCNIRSP